MNELKEEFEVNFLQIQRHIEEEALNAKLLVEALDVTLPGTRQQNRNTPYYYANDGRN